MSEIATAINKLCGTVNELRNENARLEAENADLKERLFRFGEENERMASALASFERDNADIREASKAAYMGLLVLKTMCAKKGLLGGVEATDSAIRQLIAVMPELPALSALRGSVVSAKVKP